MLPLPDVSATQHSSCLTLSLPYPPLPNAGMMSVCPLEAVRTLRCLYVPYVPLEAVRTLRCPYVPYVPLEAVRTVRCLYVLFVPWKLFVH